MHGLWLNDDSQYLQAKELIDDYQQARSLRIRQETQQKFDSGEIETFYQRLLNRPVQFIMLLAIIIFIIYVSIMPFLNFGQA